MNNIISINNPADMAAYIDHTSLKPDIKLNDIEKLCNEAIEYNFWSVCVNSFWVSKCFSILKNTNVKLCSVVGFPLGAMEPESMAFEAKKAVKNGADEIDMVLNIGALKSGDLSSVENGISKVKKAIGKKKLLKVILETCLLNNEEKVTACNLAKKVNADFVKTSTGFSTGGATADNIILMRKTVGSSMGVKASGGIRSYEDAKLMIESGATRIGASSGIAIVAGGKGGSGY